MSFMGPGRLGLAGHLRLVCARGGDGASYLAEKSYAVPLHVSKPYWDGHGLLVNLVSPTAGMLEGDCVDCSVQVKPGASLILSAPAATRVHTMRGGGTAKLDQRFVVRNGGFLEYNPEPLILQSRSNFTQHTRVELEAGAEVLFLENLLPGRVAHGEAFAFDSFRNRLEIMRADRPVVLENYSLTAGAPSLRDWQSAFPEAGYVGFYSFSPCWAERQPPLKEIEALQDEELLLGITQVAEDGWAIRGLAANPLCLRKTIGTVREMLLDSLGRHITDLRRL